MKSQSDRTPHLPTLISSRLAIVFEGVNLIHWRGEGRRQTKEMGEPSGGDN